MSENKDSITLGPGFQAFARGVAAGDKASENFDASNDDKRAERLAFYWLHVGVQMAGALPDADDDAQLQFIAGAATRAPSPAAVSVTIDRLDNAAFGHEGDDEDSFDEEECRAEIAQALRRVALRISDGADEGPVRDTNGNTVGKYSVNLWQ